MLVLYCREIGLCPPSTWYTVYTIQYTSHKWGDSQFSGGWGAEAGQKLTHKQNETNFPPIHHWIGSLNTPWWCVASATLPHPPTTGLEVLSHFGGMWPFAALPHPNHHRIGNHHMGCIPCAWWVETYHFWYSSNWNGAMATQ